MNYRSARIVTVVFVLLTAAVRTVMGDTLEETEGRGLVVRSEPSQAVVFINGIERGLTPFTLETIEPGEYGVRLVKDGYRERRIWVTVRENRRLEATLNLEAVLGILTLDIQRKAGSPPPDRLALRPEIIVDGELQNSAVLSLPVGYRTVRVRAFGWEEAVHSVYVHQEFSRRLKVEMQAAPFNMTGAELRRVRFNPANSGSLGMTEISFNVSAPGLGRIVIENQGGDTVFARDLGPFDTWFQSVAWNGRNREGQPLPDGPYRVLALLESLPEDGASRAERRAEMTVNIDSSLNIYPLASSALVSGLFFSPLPDLGPRGSFQVDGTLLFGSAVAAGDLWSALPFAAALRFSPADNFEITGAINITPYFATSAASSLGGSVKWAFAKAGAGPGAAAALSYAWANEGTLTPFGAPVGLALSLPLSWRLGEAVSLALSPGVFWTGEEGYPAEAAPRLLLSGGLLFRRTVFTAGLSLQGRLRIAGAGGEGPRFGPLMAAAEIRFFPPPSNLVFSLTGGGWAEGGRGGGFGGIGIGLIY
ncbi:MAG: PEGA domain-containing protein [Spirochaetaceae bacterium]|nr:PEGA domain-containing protein [Spirochaetaceae bacterium]